MPKHSLAVGLLNLLVHKGPNQGRSMRFHRTINAKLSLLTTVAAGVALSLSCIAFFINDVRMIRASKVRELSALATILGANTTAAVEFNDAKTATELLASLRQQPAVEFACLYDAHGKLFATYPAELPEGLSCPRRLAKRFDLCRLRSLGHRRESRLGGRQGEHDLLAGGHARTEKTDMGLLVDYAGRADGLSGGVGGPGPPAPAFRHRADLAAGRSHAARHP